MAESSNSKIHERKARQIRHHKDFRFDLGVGCISCCMKCCNAVGASSAWLKMVLSRYRRLLLEIYVGNLYTDDSVSLN